MIALGTLTDWISAMSSCVAAIAAITPLVISALQKKAFFLQFLKIREIERTPLFSSSVLKRLPPKLSQAQ
jgi:hypothetical protein